MDECIFTVPNTTKITRSSVNGIESKFIIVNGRRRKLPTIIKAGDIIKIKTPKTITYEYE